MNTRWIIGLAGCVALVSACVTINVYFPAAAAEQAADQFIDGVWGSETRRRESDAPRTGEGTEGAVAPPVRGVATAAVAAIGNFLLPAAHAQPADFDISSPAIRRIEASMQARHRELEPYYTSGAVGLNRDGLVEIRDANAVPLAERNHVRKLVADENTDRNNLYREIAVANDNPQWEPRIREVFARRWIERARSGWYYRDGDGNWQQK